MTRCLRSWLLNWKPLSASIPSFPFHGEADLSCSACNYCLFRQVYLYISSVQKWKVLVDVAACSVLLCCARSVLRINWYQRQNVDHQWIGQFQWGSGCELHCNGIWLTRKMTLNSQMIEIEVLHTLQFPLLSSPISLSPLLSSDLLFSPLPSTVGEVEWESSIEAWRVE